MPNFTRKIVWLWVIALCPLARAELRWSKCRNALNASTGIGDWRLQIHQESRARIRDDQWDEIGLTDCREVQEVAGTYICLSFHRADMNKIFGRISVFAEGGYATPAKTVPGHSNVDVIKLNMMTSGQDLKSEDINAFFNLTLKKCVAGEVDFCLNEAERQFFDKILPVMNARHEKYVVLAFSNENLFSYQENIGHEILHAQYFLLPGYALACRFYWMSRVTEVDRARISQILATHGGYDPKDEELMINEFQAYILKPGADKDALAEFVSPHAAALQAVLTVAGTPPIQVH